MTTQHNPKYDLTHLAMVGADGIPVFLIPSATPDQTLNAKRKAERATILRAVNSHEALLEAAKLGRAVIIQGMKYGFETIDLNRDCNRIEKLIDQAEGKP